MTKHIPVLLNEVLEYLDPKPDQNYIDATFGGGGHTVAILKRTEPKGKLLALDRDSEAIQRFQQGKRVPISNFSKRVTLVHGNFSDIKEIYASRFSYPVSGILFDLGISSDQLIPHHDPKKQRGISFQKDEPLDMRMDQSDKHCKTAHDIVNRWSQDDIERILAIYGEEKAARRIAQAICAARKRTSIDTTQQLVQIIKDISQQYNSHARRRHHLHPATKTFQALRIAVNEEFAHIEKALPQAIDILESEGRLAVISFHGGEDRITKRFFKKMSDKGAVKILTRKPVVPAKEEIAQNPRSRSAKLRVIEKISSPKT